MLKDTDYSLPLVLPLLLLTARLAGWPRESKAKNKRSNSLVTEDVHWYFVSPGIPK